MAGSRRPIHLPIIAAASASLYAGTLVAVTAAEADRVAAVGRAHAPVAAAYQVLREQNDRLEAAVGDAVARYERASAGYRGTVEATVELGDRLEDLARRVGGLRGSVAAFHVPGRVVLPPAGHVASPRPRPATHATTGASGG